MSTSELSLFRLIDSINEPLSWSIDVFCRLVLSEMQDLQVVQVTEIRHYKEKDGLEHEFLIIGTKHGGKHHMLRIERSTPARVQRTFWQKLKQTSSSILPALDTVSISSSFKKLTAKMNRGPIIHVATLPISPGTVTIHDLCLLLSLFPSFSPIYKLKDEQCYWFCNVILTTMSSLGNLTLTRGEGFKKAGKYGRLSINMSPKACQLFIDGFQIVRKLQHKPDELGQIELTPDIAQTLVAMLIVQSDEAKSQALLSIASLASSSFESRQLLLDAGSPDKFRLIFLSSPPELKVLIFLALDALDILHDFDIFPDVDLIYGEKFITTGDAFTEEDGHALDLRYAKALRDVIDLCQDVRPTVRSRSAKVFFMHAKCRSFILDTIPHMATSSTSEVRLTSVMAITKLAECLYLQVFPPEEILRPFPALLNDPSRDIRIASMATLRKLAEEVGFRRLCIAIFPLIGFLFLCNNAHMVSKIESLYSDGFVRSIELAIINEISCLKLDDLYEVGLWVAPIAARYRICYPIIMDILPQSITYLTSTSWRYRVSAIKILSDLTVISEFRPHVRGVILKMFNLLRDDHSHVRQSAAEFMVKAASDSYNHTVILALFPHIVGLLADESWKGRQIATHLLSNLVLISEFRLHVKEVIAKVFVLLQDDDNDVRQSAVEFMTMASFNPNLCPDILEVISQVVGLFTEESWKGRQAAADLLSNLIPISQFQPHIEEAIPKVFDLLREHDRDFRRSAVQFMTKAASNCKFHPTILKLFPQIVDLLTDQSWTRRETAINLLSFLTQITELRSRVEEAIPQVLSLLNDNIRFVQDAVIAFLKGAVSYFHTHPAVIYSISQLTPLLGEGNRDTVNLFCDYMAYADLRQNIVPEVRKLLDSEDWTVRESAKRVLTKASEYGVD